MKQLSCPHVRIEGRFEDLALVYTNLKYQIEGLNVLLNTCLKDKSKKNDIICTIDLPCVPKQGDNITIYSLDKEELRQEYCSWNTKEYDKCIS